MKTLLVCLAPFLLMLATAGLLSSGCTADKPACTPEAPPPVPSPATFRELAKSFSSWTGEMRVEDQKVTCWIHSTGNGTGISCLSDAQRSDAQRKDVTP
ncbi:MAG: hypothetical protein KKD89_07125 [Candidatus Omnitrophica bacterium]|nr:hypothetical protein [Candidatus Omnitrophota bacterium]